MENICEQFMLFAESKAFRGHKMTMEELTEKLNTLLRANDYPVLYKYENYQRQQADTLARQQLEKYRARIGPSVQPKQITEQHKPLNRKNQNDLTNAPLGRYPSLPRAGSPVPGWLPCHNRPCPLCESGVP